MGLFALQSWLPARALVQEALEGRHKVDPSGQIIKLPVAGCPWKEHLAQLEEEQKLGDAIKFCLYEVSMRCHRHVRQPFVAFVRPDFNCAAAALQVFYAHEGVIVCVSVCVWL